MSAKRSNKKAPVFAGASDVSYFPYAGIIQIRCFGCILRSVLRDHPLLETSNQNTQNIVPVFMSDLPI